MIKDSIYPRVSSNKCTPIFLIILTRCTWLVQFHKEFSYEEGHHILGLLHLSDDEEQNKAKMILDWEIDNGEVKIAKCVASSASSFIMSYWKKFPSIKSLKDLDSQYERTICSQVDKLRSNQGQSNHTTKLEHQQNHNWPP